MNQHSTAPSLFLGELKGRDDTQRMTIGRVMGDPRALEIRVPVKDGVARAIEADA